MLIILIHVLSLLPTMPDGHWGWHEWRLCPYAKTMIVSHYVDVTSPVIAQYDAAHVKQDIVSNPRIPIKKISLCFKYIDIDITYNDICVWLSVWDAWRFYVKCVCLYVKFVGLCLRCVILVVKCVYFCMNCVNFDIKRVILPMKQKPLLMKYMILYVKLVFYLNCVNRHTKPV